MGEITPDLIKKLREMTGAGMMDCKKALSETAGAYDDAVDWLRKKGLAAAAKKAGRAATEGLVGVIVQGNQGAVVEVNSETDFVARNDKFQAFVANVLRQALSANSVEELASRPYPGESKTIAEKLTDLIATIGENMSLRRLTRVSTRGGAIASYVHNSIGPNLGKIGVLVALESGASGDRLAALGKQLAMHIAAANPQAVSPDAVDPAAIERERAVLADKAKASGKPEAVIAKMVEGGLRKFYEDVALLEQTFVIDGERKVKTVVETAAKDAGAPIKVVGFARMALGEGIERN
ncbi:MAG: translation elongation factor Ts [Dongiaceae bacterium]